MQTQFSKTKSTIQTHCVITNKKRINPIFQELINDKTYYKNHFVQNLLYDQFPMFLNQKSPNFYYTKIHEMIIKFVKNSSRTKTSRMLFNFFNPITQNKGINGRFNFRMLSLICSTKNTTETVCLIFERLFSISSTQVHNNINAMVAFGMLPSISST